MFGRESSLALLLDSAFVGVVGSASDVGRRPIAGRRRLPAAMSASQGGFCGGPGQVPHLAPTYAAVNALCTIGTDEALSVINRQTLADFIRKMRDPETGMHAYAQSRRQGHEGLIRENMQTRAHASLTLTVSMII